MDFVRFEYLIALDECKSFSRAAEKCFISQPALTKSINKLEESLGVRLFDRSKTPIALTYAGEHYLRGVRNIMAMKTQLDLEMAEIAGNRKEHLAVGRNGWGRSFPCTRRLTRTWTSRFSSQPARAWRRR